jgi:putative addiction module component (TIGR02574 family)
MALPKLDVGALSPAERLKLIELDSADVGLTPAQHAELARRLDDMETNPGDVTSWPDAQRRIRERKR